CLDAPILSNAQIRQGVEPNATFWVGAAGETGDFKGLTLSNSSPVHLGSRGFSLNRGRGGLGKADMSTTRTHFTFRVAMLQPRPPKPPPPRPPKPPPPPPCRIARTASALRGDARRRTLPGAATVAYLLPHHACSSTYPSDWFHRPVPPHQSPHAAVRRCV